MQQKNANTNISVIVQYQLIVSAHQYISQALIDTVNYLLIQHFPWPGFLSYN